MSRSAGAPAPRHRRAELALALAALAVSLGLNFAAGRYADRVGRGAPSAPDFLLQRLPVMDARGIFVWGFAAFVLWAGVCAWRERGRAAYVVWSYALLITVRAFFIILTPLGRPPQALDMEGDVLFDAVGRYLTFKHDLFFSSHTALPYLGALVFRGFWVRLSFMAFSLLLAAAVLLARAHYSIDVFGAYLITYAVHRLEARWFQPAYLRARSRLLAG